MSETITYDGATGTANLAAFREAGLSERGVYYFIGVLCGHVPVDVWQDALALSTPTREDA